MKSGSQFLFFFKAHFIPGPRQFRPRPLNATGGPPPARPLTGRPDIPLALPRQRKFPSFFRNGLAQSHLPFSARRCQALGQGQFPRPRKKTELLCRRPRCDLLNTGRAGAGHGSRIACAVMAQARPFFSQFGTAPGRAGPGRRLTRGCGLAWGLP